MAPRAPLADPELFAVDTQGSTAVRNALLTEYNQGGVSRRRKGATKPLKSAQIIADRDAATAAAVNKSSLMIAKREREREGGVSKSLKRKLDVMAKRDARGEGLWSVSSGKKRANEVSHAAKVGGTYDTWTVDQLELARREAIPVDIRDIADPVKPKPPVSLRKHSILHEVAPQAIALPHPGTSYNPTQSEHQLLLRKALTLAEADEAQKAKDVVVKAQQQARRDADRGRELWEHAEMDVDRREDDQLSVASGSNETLVERHATKRKTEKAKRKAALNRKAEALAKRQRAIEKANRHTISALPGVVRTLRRSVATKEAGRLAAQQAKAAVLSERGLAGKRVGVARAPEANVDFQLGEELAEGLRTLKPEGNLWRDWQGSATRRGKVEAPRLRTSEKRKAKTKRVEKHGWKRFE